jgi:hypothetical protein
MVQKTTAENMATKLAFDPNKMAAMSQVRKALREIPKEDLATFPFSVGAVAALLDKDPKTLHSARVTREEMLDEEKVIPPLWLESIPFAGTPTAATYMALDLVEYLDRLALAPTLRVWEQKLPDSYPKLKLPRSFLGFQSWLAHAEVTELWPFAIQPDGRPMDVIAAILSERVGDDVRWLTIRQFGDLAADAATHRHVKVEQTGIGDVTRIPERKSPAEQEEDRKKRTI